jgi:AcrR family transcriptional regulator
MSSILSKEDARAAVVRSAAIQVFARYGFAKATMGDIAREAGMSRPALYLLFPNKEALFHDLAQSLLEEGLAAAKSAWALGDPAYPGLHDALLAKELPIFRLLKSSPHADEILSANTRLLGDMHMAVEARFADLLAVRLAAAGVSEPKATAALVTHALHGLKTANSTEDAFRSDVERLSRLIAHA